MWETDIRQIRDLRHVSTGAILQLLTPIKVSFVVDRVDSRNGIVIEGVNISHSGPYNVSLRIPPSQIHGKAPQVTVVDGDENLVSTTDLEHLAAGANIGTVLLFHMNPEFGEFPIVVPSDLRFLTARRQLVAKGPQGRLVMKLDAMNPVIDGGVSGRAQIVNSSFGHEAGEVIDFSLNLDSEKFVIRIDDENHYFEEISYVEQTRRRSSSGGDSPRGSSLPRPE